MGNAPSNAARLRRTRPSRRWITSRLSHALDRCDRHILNILHFDGDLNAQARGSRERRLPTATEHPPTSTAPAQTEAPGFAPDRIRIEERRRHTGRRVPVFSRTTNSHCHKLDRRRDPRRRLVRPTHSRPHALFRRVGHPRLIPLRPHPFRGCDLSFFAAIRDGLVGRGAIVRMVFRVVRRLPVAVDLALGIFRAGIAEKLVVPVRCGLGAV